nr:hypothetical protein [Alkalihalobacterium elongatum]
MYPYDYSYAVDPNYGQYMQQYNMAGDYDMQRQFQVWGPFVGGVTGLFGPPGRPPGPPGVPPFGPPPGPPAGPGQAGPPSGPPPAFTPAEPEIAAFAVDPGAIRGCLFRYTFVWLTNRERFWYFPTFVGRTSVAGWRWTGWNWVYFGIDLRRISSFQCV